MHRTGPHHTPWRTVHIAPGARIAAAGLLFIATLLAIAGCASSTATGKTSTTSRPVVEGPLASVVGPAASPLAQRISTAYDASAQQAKVTITIGAAPDVATAQARVMSLCFQVERALWASNPALREVKVIVLGPIRDDYSNIIDDAYGVSDVFAPTAAKLPWNTLTPESAWIHYDATWLRASYKPNWLYGKNN